MKSFDDPLMYTTIESKDFLSLLAKDIEFTVGEENSHYFLDYPIIYVHVWQSEHDTLNKKYSIYIGESIDVVQRTKEHWDEAYKKPNPAKPIPWQRQFATSLDINGKHITPKLYVFAHPEFTKSITLDVENRLIDYCMSMSTARPNNGRTNKQGDYAHKNYFQPIFKSIWAQLRKDNPNLFLNEDEVKASALYRASPNHTLNDCQSIAKELIIQRAVKLANENNPEHQLIFVQGEAGTGKTVLTSQTYFELIDRLYDEDDHPNAYLLINHKEQYDLFRNLARRMRYDEANVLKPTTFLNSHSIKSADGKTLLPDPKKVADIVFIDEGHLLWTRKNQSFSTKYPGTQLEEIMKRAKLTIVMFDQNQVMDRGQVFSQSYLDNLVNLAKKQGNYIELVNQERMKCSQSTLDWIDGITKCLEVNALEINKNCHDSNSYEVKIFDDPNELYKAIKLKNDPQNGFTARMVATYDWEYSDKNRNPNGKYWEVKVGDFALPWNDEIYYVDILPTATNAERQRLNSLSWAARDYTINEIGSTFSVQGFDLAYVGVILGPSVKYNEQTHRIYIDETKRVWQRMKSNKDDKENYTEEISKHELRVLLTRGTNGLYIYACDEKLREALKKCVNIKELLGDDKQ